MYLQLFPYLLGAGLAWITLYPVPHLSPARERRFLTTIIWVVALSFVGFPLAGGDSAGVGYELAALALFAVLLVLGTKFHPLWIGVVYLAHGLWDLVFLLGSVPVHKPIWVCQICVSYDWILGTWVLLRLDRWKKAAAAERTGE